ARRLFRPDILEKPGEGHVRDITGCGDHSTPRMVLISLMGFIIIAFILILCTFLHFHFNVKNASTMVCGVD
ncbi:MAG TPA: hypothetical protein VKI62_01575, partial [Bacteroidota bacterium]|nr:hypothetical protein [Bacteroidota bacterium]